MPSNLVQARQFVERWNAAVRVGAEVLVGMDDGRRLKTKTTAAAAILPSGVAVVWLEGVPGCYLLSRVTPVVHGGK